MTLREALIREIAWERGVRRAVEELRRRSPICSACRCNHPPEGICPQPADDQWDDTVDFH